MNLWILTEERPKKEVIKVIVTRFAKDSNKSVKFDNIKIIPEIINKRFTYKYLVKGIELEDTNSIFLKSVSGDGSFVDFIVFYQENEPDSSDKPLYLIEETKTDDRESRNTGVYQRCSKFVYANFIYPDVPKIMLYNLKVKQKEDPTDTYIFGTRMLLNLGVEILGKKLDYAVFKPFTTIDEFIKAKNDMSDPNYGTPVKIKKLADKIYISAKLEKSGFLSHDPNIGMTAIMSACLRKLGWKNDITITEHALPDQKSVGKSNKFIKIANKLKIGLRGLTIPQVDISGDYWKYEYNQEKIATIFVHLVCEEFADCVVIYENHGGCERGYFIDINEGDYSYVVIPKYRDREKYKEGHKEYIISIPDVVIYDKKRKIIINGEGKTFENKEEGIEDLKNFDFFEEKYVKKHYPNIKIIRAVILNGGNEIRLNINQAAFLLNGKGELIVGEYCPDTIKEAIGNLLNLNEKQ